MKVGYRNMREDPVVRIQECYLALRNGLDEQMVRSCEWNCK